MNKSNVAAWFGVLYALIVVAVVALCWFGVVPARFDVSRVVAAAQNCVLAVYLGVINVGAFALFGYDKRVAVKYQGSGARSRVPEATLLGACLLGGALGGMVGMRVFRHKTLKWYFRFGLPAFLVLHVAIFVLAAGGGLI